MERKLTLLLDFQRFERNQKLAQLIAQTYTRYFADESEELADADLSVNAAGEPPRPKKGGPHA